MAKAYLHVDRLTKRFGSLTVLDQVSLEIGEGETLVLLGPSGSGKTTLLRSIAGFERPDSGAIRIDGADITDLSPAAREFGMVFQHYALFPHMSVGDNVAFGLQSRGVRSPNLEARVAEALELVELEGFESRSVDQVSGGQQQRVALARALAPEPRVLLLDEPLSNLDPALRERTRRQIRSAIRRVGITAIWVTHEQEEAFDVGDRVAVLSQGMLEQVGRPEELYLRPKSPFVARFVGRASSVSGVWTREGSFSFDLGATGSGVWPAVAGEALEQGEAVSVFFRPEGLALAETRDSPAVTGEVVDRRYTGARTLYTVVGDAGQAFEVEGEVTAAAVGDRVGVTRRADGPEGVAFRASPGDAR